MMNFKQESHKTTVSIVESRAPHVIISADAASKMYLYVDECKEEVGWLGTAVKTDNTIYISDVYLLDQKVHATTTEIDPEGLLKFAEEILSKPDGGDVWNNLKVYGHSHVNMGCSPSGQDDKQLEEFVKGGHEWFIRLIANKKGDMRIDFYDYTNGFAFNDVKWTILASEEENSIMEQIDALYAELDAMQDAQLTQFSDIVKAEVAAKVKPLYTTPTYGKGYTTNQFGTGYGYYDDLEGSYYGHPYKGKQSDLAPKALNAVKKESKKKTSVNDYEFGDNDDELDQFFTAYDVYNIAEVEELEDVEIELSYCGYADVFSRDEMENIWEYCKRKVLQYESKLR